MTDRTDELFEKLICLDLHYRGVQQKNIASFLGRKLAYVNTLLKPLRKAGEIER